MVKRKMTRTKLDIFCKGMFYQSITKLKKTPPPPLSYLDKNNDKQIIVAWIIFTFKNMLY